MEVKTKLNKVVIIDDDGIHNFLSTKLLNKLKISETLRTFKNANEGLSYIKNSCQDSEAGVCPDLILLDKVMPEMGAKDILDELKSSGIHVGKQVRVALISSAFKAEECQEFLMMGVLECISKPLKEEDINRLIENNFHGD
ncbi:MAG: response regulator [Cytophagaceae bacterium]